MEKKGKLELTWVGKYEEEKLEPRILIEDKSKSYGDPDTENMLIHGDNLLALKALERDYAGKIKCVYIDPPYNTGNAFEHYDDDVEHSLWLNMIYKRVQILHKLLSKDGTLWMSIDSTEGHYLKVMCDEIFGRSNFVSDITYEKSNVTGLGQGGAIFNTGEKLLVYKKETVELNEVLATEKLTKKTMQRYRKYIKSEGRRELVDEFESASNGLPVKIYKHTGYEIGDISLKNFEAKNVLPYAKQEFIKKVEELKKVAISVPKIGISYSSTITFKSFTVKRNIMDFDVAASRIERYDAVNGKLLQVLDADALIVENPENMLAVSLLESIPEFSSDDAEFILEVVDQYLALIEGTDEEKKKIVRRYATVIVEDLRKQIYASKEESNEFVFNVQKDLIVFKSFAKNMKENGRLNFKKEVPDKKNIKQYLFEGYKKSYYAENAFDSDDERRLSVVLEEDSEVIRFIKPPLNQLGLFYKAAKQYNPDFLVETADKKYMIEE